ncbi:MAG: hypothetical protein F4Y79_18715 [Gemmatimonadetes bacterium]|nr:hypothetical protein [Gemmatimonadota bacterium]MYF15914.1 hypothetical protein [Gemmatimonadota bacterium]
MRYFLTCITLVLCTAQVYAQQPSGVKAEDTPNDSGGSITVVWNRAELPDGAMYKIVVSESETGPFHPAANIDPSGNLQSSDPGTFGHGEETSQMHFAKIAEYADPADPSKQIAIKNDKTYYVQVIAHLPYDEVFSSTITSAEAYENLFNRTKTNNFILGTIFSLIILGGIFLAQKRELFIRRIAGLEALDEALGRATEMGKPVLFAHGLASMGSVSTIAAVNVLSRVANRTAEFNTELRVANNDPVVMAVSQEVVKESYLNAGRPDAYSEDSVFMVATEQFSYAAALDGMMVRDRPATNIMMGYFYAESLLLAETGASIGAIQIAGTDSYTQLPFFITTCDYTLMGEELYAASAYLSREPKLLGSLKGQDIGKAVLLVILILGTLLATLGNQTLTHIFTAY